MAFHSRLVAEAPAPDGVLAGMDILALDAAGSQSERDLLIRLAETAELAPPSLRAYGLHQIELAVLTGQGLTRDHNPPAAGCITETECALLQRLLYCGADSRIGPVSPDEAELLFRIKDATLGGDNAPEWPLLFVRGVAGYLDVWYRWLPQVAGQAHSFVDLTDDRQPRLLRFLQRASASRTDRAVERALGLVDPDSDGNRDSPREPLGRLDELEHALLVWLVNEPIPGHL